jgi:hypothetical protein
MSKSYGCFCLWILIAAMPVAAAAGDSSLVISGNCDHTLGFYADSHYRVGQVIVHSPFYLSSLQTLMPQSRGRAEEPPSSDWRS